jgi:hypothetical protein
MRSYRYRFAGTNTGAHLSLTGIAEFLYATAVPLSLPAACSIRAATAFGCEK